MYLTVVSIIYRIFLKTVHGNRAFKQNPCRISARQCVVCTAPCVFFEPMEKTSRTLWLSTISYSLINSPFTVPPLLNPNPIHNLITGFPIPDIPSLTLQAKFETLKKLLLKFSSIQPYLISHITQFYKLGNLKAPGKGCRLKLNSNLNLLLIAF